jgi:hypothetical protein
MKSSTASFTLHRLLRNGLSIVVSSSSSSLFLRSAVSMIAIVRGLAHEELRSGILDILESVRSLAVNRVVTDNQVLVRHTQRNSADILDEDADQARPHDVPADNEACTSKLPTDLDTIASNATTRGDGRKSDRALSGRENTNEEATADTSDHVSVEDAEHVVDSPEEGESLAENVHGHPWNAARSDANDDGSPTSDNTYTAQLATSKAM